MLVHMVGANASRPPPSATGSFSKTPWLHLLVYVHGKKLSGTVELSAPDGTGAEVLFVEGEPARIRTRVRGLPSKPSEGDELGRKLRQIACMPPSTEYAYYPGFDELAGAGRPAKGVDPIPLLWGVLRENPPREHVVAGLARLGASGVRLSTAAEVNRLALPNEEAQAVERLRAQSLTPAALASAARIDERSATLLVYLLLLTKQGDMVAPSEARVASDPSVPPVASSPRPTSSVSLPAHAKSVSSAPFAAIAPPAALAPDLARRWREVIERATDIDRTDYFSMLGVARDATRDDVEAAYFGLAKRWHPDRLSPELAPVKDACSRVFARMSEAHATLADQEQRKKYMHLLADGSGSPESQEVVAKAVVASTNFQKAEVLFRKGDLTQAEAFCRKAVEGDATQADYHAFLAWLIALKPESQTPEKTAECIAKLGNAIGVNDRCERAYFWRGMLYKRLGKNDVALDDFRRAAELNPRNIDAAREVRLHQMRTGRLAGSRSLSSSSTRPPVGSDSGSRSVRPSFLNRIFKPPSK